MSSNILAINDGIGSSIGIFENGEPVFCIEEERFNRVKNWLGYPTLSVQYLSELGKINPEQIDYVVITNERFFSGSKEDFYKYYDLNFKEAYQRLTSGNKRVKEGLKSQLKKTFLYDIYNMSKKKKEEEDATKNKLLKLGFQENQILRLNHHLCHASAVYYGLAKKLDEKYLVFTLDGGGDMETDTVHIGHNAELEKQTSSCSFSIGNMYSCITYFLGFRPHEHEYKLMGLAPYVNPVYSDEYCNYFKQFLDLKSDDTEFYNPSPLNHSEFLNKLLNDLNKDRFDNIAAGLQKFTEEICIRWIKGNIKKYKTNKILLSGGVFMNVKMNKLIAELPEVEFVDAFPSCGDESNIFGGAFFIHNREFNKKVGLLKSYTLGTNSNRDLVTSLAKHADSIVVDSSSEINKAVAKLLADNKIVARCSGNMEFGARALGNRSIMANPSKLQNITKINQAVKKRDFWMPFAPAILIDKAHEYVDIPTSIQGHGSPYMMFAVDTLDDDKKRQDITCGIHQSDFTARIEGVNDEIYPDFYDIINEFYKITGIPCVLNTSFNLHGFPIVENSDQAIKVLLKSKIDYLIIDDKIISRKEL